MNQYKVLHCCNIAAIYLIVTQFHIFAVQYHSYLSMANKEISSLLTPSGAIKIYSQSLTCSTTGGELEFYQNNSLM